MGAKLFISLILFLFLSLNIAYTEDFVKVNGTDFYLDGKPYFFAGTNSYFLWYGNYNCNKTNPSPNGQCVTELFDDAKAMNFTVIRVWGFSDGPHYWGSLQPSAGLYNETNFRKYDKLIKEAGNRDLKLIITLVNNWNDYGGMCRYLQWCGVEGACSGVSGTHDQFYTNNCTKELYKNYVAYFLNRTNTLTGIKYKDDPTIFAWELANEPRSKSDTSGTTLYDWISEMSAHIKSIDPNHLVATGEDGFYVDGGRPEYGYNGEDGVDFIRNSMIPTVDFASFHVYDWTGFENSLYWIERHAYDARYVIKKPIVAGELGYSRSSPNFEPYLTAWYNSLEINLIDGDLLWMLCPTNFFESGGKCVYYPSDPISDFIAEHADYMNSINYTNNPPLLQPIGNIIVNETEKVVIAVNATDPDGDNLNYYIDDNRYTKNDNVFEWQTEFGDKGIYHITVYVNDGSRANVSTSFYVIVRENKPCDIPTDDMSITRNMTFCLDVYKLPSGLSTNTNNVEIDCDGSILIGNNTGTGIFAKFDNGTIENCEIRNYQVGIDLFYGTNNSIKNNKLIYNRYYALYLDRGSNNKIINNTIRKTNNYVGLQLYLSNNNTIEFNEISYHDKGVWNYGDGNKFFYNNLYNNGAWNFFNAGEYNVSAEYNWWGTTNEDLIKNKIFDCLDYLGLGCVYYKPHLCAPYSHGKISYCPDVIEFMIGYGYGSGSTTNYNIIYTIMPQPSSYLNSSTYRIYLGWPYYLP